MTLDELLVVEATKCDFKEILKAKKPKSWLKSISAFANEVGGTLLIGVTDKRKVVGLADMQNDIDTIGKQNNVAPLKVGEFGPQRLKDISHPYDCNIHGITLRRR